MMYCECQSVLYFDFLFVKCCVNSVFGAGGTALKAVEGKHIGAVSGMGAFGNRFIADKIPSKPDCYALHHPTWLETERVKRFTKEQYLQWTLWMIEVFKAAKNDCLNQSPMDEITQRMGAWSSKRSKAITLVTLERLNPLLPTMATRLVMDMRAAVTRRLKSTRTGLMTESPQVAIMHLRR